MFHLTPRLFYLVLTIPFAITWLALFLFKKETRQEQLETSVRFLPVGLVVENVFYFQDYWNPASTFGFEFWLVKVYIEFFLYSFSVAGIGAVFYQVLFGKTPQASNRYGRADKKEFWLAVLAVAAFTYILFMLGINSIFATSFGSLLLAGYMVAKRNDLVYVSLVSGLLLMVYVFIAEYTLYSLFKNAEEILQQTWFLYYTSLGRRFLSVPLTELFWSFSVGMSLGILYKFRYGLAFK